MTAETSIVTFDTGSFTAMRLSGFDDDETPAEQPMTNLGAPTPATPPAESAQPRNGAPKSTDFRARTTPDAPPAPTEPVTGLDHEQLNQVAWFETEIPAGNTPTDPVTTKPADSPAATASAPAAHDHPSAGPTPTHPSSPRASTPMGTASSRRRRRSEDSADSGPRLSVAEIMANLRSESEN
ncbi:hypothetical protein [Nocardia inohanensis]|uniref:hypothetical protein n=1 Tax=Nocardia inohanensis TaxID=209246 RepID=UPI00082ECE87|nr:hypothetical protein [Nocardia inohanensis]